MKPRSDNIVWHRAQVTAGDRQRVLGQRGCVIWLTGLSGSGKSTVARALERALLHDGHAAYVLDGDNLRHGLNADLDFSPPGRAENIRRVAEVAALFADAGLLVVTAFISPCAEDRRKARSIVNRDGGGEGTEVRDRFVEVYVNAPLEVCEARDPKALYAKARAGEIREFTGISAPFEAPENPELELKTGVSSVEECVSMIMRHLDMAGFTKAVESGRE